MQQTDHNPKNVFQKAIWKIQNLLNISNITDDETAFPNLKFDTKAKLDKEYDDSLSNVNTFDMMSVVRAGITFEIPRGRDFRYNQYREMIKTNELISTIVDIYVDNVTTADSLDGAIMRINAEDEKVSNELSGLFFDRIDINTIMADVAYEVCSMGDSFWEIAPMDMMDGIESVRKLYCIEKIHRIEKDGRLIAWFVEDASPWTGPIPSMYKSTSSAYPSNVEFNNFAIDIQKFINKEKIESGRLLMPWQIVHFKIPNRLADYAPYGRSVLDACAYTWQLLRPLEDSLVVYRIVRAPERFKFYVEIGNMSPEEGISYLQRVKDMNYKESFIDPNTGTINKKYLAQDALTNYYLPMRNGQRSIELDTIAAGQNLGEINDIEYFNKKIRIASKIPQAYLQEETTDARTRPLTQLDIQFAKTIQRIQKYILKGLTKIAIIHLWLSGFKKEIKEFQLTLVCPSALEKQLRYELFNEKFALASSVITSGLMSRYSASIKILGMTKEEAEHESKLKMWEDNSILPEEGMQADSMIPTDIAATKDKIENIATGGQDQGMGDMGGMDFGGEMDAGIGGEQPAPGGEPGGAMGLQMASVSRKYVPLTEIINRKIKKAVSGMSANNAKDSLIHLYNEGELDCLYKQELGEKITINENEISEIL